MQPLQRLRQALPIGPRHGLVLLEKTSGDVAQAAALFRAEALALVLGKTGVSEDVANRHLTAANFNIPAALQTIDEKRYSLTQRILRRYKDQEDALQQVFWALIKKEGLDSSPYSPTVEGLNDERASCLAPEVHCLLVVIAWLNYESWEDFDCAVAADTGPVEAQLITRLQLPQLAQTLWHAQQISEQRGQMQPGRRAEKGSPAADFLFDRLRDAFHQQRPQLLAALYALVQQHPAKFP